MVNLPIQDGIVELRRIAIEDAVEFIALEADPEAKKFMGGPRCKTLGDVRSYVSENHAPDDLDLLVVTDRSSKQFLGRAGLLPNGPDEVELHCVLKKTAQGNGYGRATFLILIRVAEMLGKSPVAIIHPENVMSLKLFKALGFVQSGLHRTDGWQDGHLVFRTKEFR